jgi:UDP-N-acetylmuramoyl-tripeptide--D-alanyl-D-alanine ligase
VIQSYGSELKEVEATLEGTRFSVELDGQIHWFTTSLLGAFHAQNLLACIHVARSFGMDIEEIKEAISTISPVEHRLSPIRAGGKLILDDSYNGNKEGMEAFDIVIITGSANAQTLLHELKKPKVHLLKDKSQLEELLAKETASGDLILFSNDAPSYI